MSQTIDSRVVQMQFDNKQFESGAAQSMGTLKNLDKALNGVDGAKAFADISRAAGNVDLSGVMNGVSALQDRFSVMGTFVHNTLLGMVESAVNAGKQITNALVFSPAKTGFAEYELQLNSTQRILANTKSKGEDIKSVNAALDQLNEYADLTIYNFSQMTDNIGRFTAAGVGLDDSVMAIKGLSNAAALFGADSNAAARAGYQLSQALAAGTIKLMDWNSLVNSSMGGEQMQNAIMRVARNHGVAIDAMIEKEGSFRETLSQGWLTSDIMLEALSHFTTANDEASKAALRAKGYTEEEIAAIVELGETATESATVVKTASQLFNTLGEELGSAWAQTWRSIMGDYEEAKTTFSAIHEELSGIVGAWADAQTALVEGWAELGGRTDMFDSLFNVFSALKSVLGPIGEAFKDVFPPVTSERLAEMTSKLKEFTRDLILNDDQMSKLQETAATVFTAIKNVLTPIGKVASVVFKTLRSAFKLVSDVVGKAIVAVSKGINGLQNFSAPISAFISGFERIPEALDNLKIKMDSGFLDFLPKFGNSFSDTVKNVGESISDVGKTFGEAIKNVFSNSETFLEGLKNVMSGMADVFGSFGEIISTLISGITQSITKFFSKLTGIDFSKVSDAIVYAFNILLRSGKSILDFLTALQYYDLAKFLRKQGEGLTSVLDLIKNPIKTFVDWFNSASLNRIPKSFGNMLQGIANERNTRAIRNLAVSVALLAGSLLLLSSIPWDKMKIGLVGFVAVVGSLIGVIILLAKVGGSLTATTKSFKASFTRGLSFDKVVSTKLYSLAAALISFGAAVLIMAKALKTLSDVGSWEKLGVGVAGLVTVVGSLAGSMALLSKFGGNISAKMTLPILAIGLCVRMLSGVVTELSGLNLTKAIQGAGSVVVLLGALSGALALIGTLGKVSLRSSIAMVAIAAAVKVLGNVVTIISNLKLSNAAQGVGTLVIMMGVLAGLLIATSKTGKHAVAASVAIMAVSHFISQLGETLTVMTKIAAKNPIQAAASLLAVMAVIAEVMLLMKAMPKKGGFRTAASLLAMGVAIGVLAGSLKLLSTANPLTLGANLFILGAAIAALAVSAKLLNGAIPVLLKLGLIFVEIGVGAALFAGAMAVVSVALLSLSTTIAILAGSIIANAPLIGQALLAVVQMILNVIIGTADQIAEAIFAVILAVLGRIREAIPQIIEQLAMIFVDSMNALTEYAPQMSDALFNLFMTVFDSLIPRVPEFMAKLREFLDAIFGELKDMVKDVTVDDVEQLGILIVAVIGVLGIIGKIHGVALAALKGLGVVSLVLVAIGGVLAGFGALAKIPGINELVASGGELLSKIGYAIGDFVGSIIGGFGAGATSGLPEIGSNLSQFSTNVEPFVSYMKANGTTLLTSIGQILDASIKIKDIKDVKADKLVKFADSLNEFATPFKSFCDTMDGINVSAVSTAALAAKRLAEMVQILSESGGGLQGLIAGNGVSLEDFGKQLEPFAKSLKVASDSFEGVKGEFILAAVPAAEALSELAGSMYRTGGVWQKFVGEHLSMDDFGSQVESFATALKDASESFADVKVGSIEAALPAATALADLAGEMVRFGGVWQEFTGEKTTLSGFGTQVSAFATGLAEASTSFENVKVEAITNAIPAAQALAEFASAMGTEGGVAGWFGGEKESLSSFGADLKSFAEAFVEFGNTVSTVPEDIALKTTTVVNALTKLASIKTEVTDLGELREGINRIANMKDNFTKFGEAIVAFSGAVAGIDTASVQNAQIATECITAIANGLPTQEEVDAIPDLSEIQTKFSSMAESIKVFGEAVGQIDPSQISNAAAAFDEIITLVNRINSVNVSSFSGLAEAFKSAAQNAVDGFKSTLSNANVSAAVDLFFNTAKNSALTNSSALTSNFVKPVEDAMTGVKNLGPRFSETGAALGKSIGSGASESQSSITSAFSTLVTSANASLSGKKQLFYNTGANLVQGLINGINSKKQAAIQAGTALGNAVSQAMRNATGVKSPSKVFMQIGSYLVQGLALGINQNGAKAVNASRALANSTIDAMKEELKIESPSKVAKDEVGNWIVEGIAEGIEGNMSAEEAAAKKAQNIVAAFQTALDKIDLEFATRGLDHKIAQMLDVTGTNLRSIKEAEARDALDKAAKNYELKKGAYDTIVKEGLADTDEGLKALNDMKQAQLDYLQAKRDYETYMLSTDDKYSLDDRLTNIHKQELEIFKKANPYASAMDISKREQELLAQQANVLKNKGADAYAQWQAAIQVYGEGATQTLTAYEGYLAIQKELTDLLVVDVDKSQENQKSFQQYLSEWATYWNEEGEFLQAQGYTYEQVATQWAKMNKYNPLTGEIAATKSNLESMNDALKNIEEQGTLRINQYVNTIKSAGGLVIDGMAGLTNGVVQATEVVANTFTTAMSNTGSAGVSALCSSVKNGSAQIVSAGNAVVAAVPEKVVPALMPKWTEAGLELIQSMIKGIESGQGALATAISKAIQDALAAAIAKFGRARVDTLTADNARLPHSEVGGPVMEVPIEIQATRTDQQTLDWLKDNPNAQWTIDFYWTLENAHKAGRLLDWTRDEKGNIIKAGAEIVSGLSTGIESQVESVEAISGTVAHAVVETISSELEINSPSKVMERFGKYTIQGFALGMTRNSNMVGQSAIKMLEVVSTEVEEGIMPPDITPVINFSDLKSEVRMANKLIGGVSMDKISSVAGAIQNGKSVRSASVTKSEIINNYDFTQNNYSPKALSNAEIYRQTKNQFASFARKRG